MPRPGRPRRPQAQPGGGATWITRLDSGGGGVGRAGASRVPALRVPVLRVAVKDLIDIAGVPTTAGCRAVASSAGPASADAACLAGLVATVAAGEARIVGKTNLHELAAGVTGMNPWFGTPVNPLVPGAVPGGSSSGSAAAVAAGEADVAFGTDTGGSVRIPAACCGIVGLKTTWGRVPLDGVWPLAPSLDTVGPMAGDVAGVMAAMALLEPGFAASVAPAVPSGPARGLWPGPVGRLRLDHLGLVADPVVDAAVDRALRLAFGDRPGLVEVRPVGWNHAHHAASVVLGAEMWAAHNVLARRHPDGIGDDVAAVLAHGAGHGHQRIRDAQATLGRWRAEVGTWFAPDPRPGSPPPAPLVASGAGRALDVLALPTIGVRAPAIGPDAAGLIGTGWTLPVNAAGLPALALPVPVAGGGPPASLQLIGRAGAELTLCQVGRQVEAAAVAGG